MHYSIVIPLYNEEGTVEELYKRLDTMASGIEGRLEFLLVNDGSTDGTLDILREHASKDPRVKIIDLSRNFGHQTAISAGIDHAGGDAVIVMDGDLQDPPEVIPEFIKKWKEGYEVVYAIRRKRKENMFKRAAYFLFYRIMKMFSKIDIPLDAGDFSLMDRRVVEELRSIPERNRFVRGLRTWVGFRQTGLAYEREGRYAGKAKYTFTKLLRLAFDGLVSFSDVPLKFAANLGFLITSAAFVGVVVYLVRYFLEIDEKTPRGFPTLIISILFLGGIQLLTIGVLGEYIGRIHEEVKGRPLYVVRKKYGFDE